MGTTAGLSNDVVTKDCEVGVAAVERGVDASVVNVGVAGGMGVKGMVVVVVVDNELVLNGRYSLSSSSNHASSSSSICLGSRLYRVCTTTFPIPLFNLGGGGGGGGGQ